MLDDAAQTAANIADLYQSSFSSESAILVVLVKDTEQSLTPEYVTSLTDALFVLSYSFILKDADDPFSYLVSRIDSQ